jgi:hypothetical protein
MAASFARMGTVGGRGNGLRSSRRPNLRVCLHHRAHKSDTEEWHYKRHKQVGIRAQLAKSPTSTNGQPGPASLPFSQWPHFM